ncbi:MAG: hypothetical protein Q9160_006903 [Pyrenula sp. 1 TL-2023]
MYLFDLPLDVFRKILHQTVTTVGIKSARRLRILNTNFCSEIDEAIIETLSSIGYHHPGDGPYDRGTANLEFMARYVRACITTKNKTFKVHEGLLDVIDRTATRLMTESEVQQAGMHFEEILLELCRMVLHALGFGEVLLLIEQERMLQTSLHPSEEYQGEMDSVTYHSVAYLLPAAIFLRLPSMTDRLLEGNPNLNALSMYFWSPLCAAAFTGQEDLVQRLLDSGANPYCLTSPSPPPSPLSEWEYIVQRQLKIAGRAAAFRGQVTILQKLLRTQELCAVSEHIHESFLIAAVRGGQTEAIQTVHRHVPSLRGLPKINELIMYEACALGHTSIVHAMLQAGVTVELFTISPFESPNEPPGLDPLKVAASFGHVSTVKLLLAHGAPLQRARERQFSPPFITALGLAAKYGYAQVAELLIERGADVNAGKLTPLNRACTFGQAHIVRLLLEKGCRLDDDASVKGKNANPERPWDHVKLAVMNGRPSVAEVLREFGVPGSPK